jgi:RNA polymerase sigma-70 factor (ECF subfamily)
MSVLAEPATAGRCTPWQVRDTDDALVERARHGDSAAFEQLVARHQAVAFRTAYVLCHDAGEAEEAAQDGFLKAYAALGRFRAGAPLRPWLLSIVANEARNRARAAGRRRRLARRAGSEPPAGQGEPSPEGLTVAGERDAELRAALARLDDRHREVLWLRYFAELSEAEAAVALGCRRGTVKSRTARALERLRAEVQA